MMKAIVVTSFGGPEVMKSVPDFDIPAISEDQVLIRVVATSVNFADTESRCWQKRK